MTVTSTCRHMIKYRSMSDVASRHVPRSTCPSRPRPLLQSSQRMAWTICWVYWAIGSKRCWSHRHQWRHTLDPVVTYKRGCGSSYENRANEIGAVWTTKRRGSISWWDSFLPCCWKTKILPIHILTILFHSLFSCCNFLLQRLSIIFLVFFLPNTNFVFFMGEILKLIDFPAFDVCQAFGFMISEIFDSLGFIQWW